MCWAVWCHFSALGHWWENCEIRARWFCAWHQKSDGQATIRALALCKCFLCFHLHNLFTQVVCSWIDLLVTFLQPWDLAPLVQPWHWKVCPTKEVKVNKHHPQVDCHEPPMTGPQKWSLNLLTKPRVTQLRPSEIRGHKRNSVFHLRRQTFSGSNRTQPWPNQSQAIKMAPLTYWSSYQQCTSEQWRTLQADLLGRFRYPLHQCKTTAVHHRELWWFFYMFNKAWLCMWIYTHACEINANIHT